MIQQPQRGSIYAFVAGLGLYFTIGFWVIQANGSTNDEFAAHITSGFLYWKTGHFAGGVNNPPLGQLWVSFLLWVSGGSLHPFQDKSPVLPRLSNLLLSAALFLFLYRACRKVGKKSAAFFGVLLTASAPEMLTQSCLATLDLPATFMICTSIWVFQSLVRSPSIKKFILLSFLVGLTISCKVTGFLLFPIFAGTIVGVLLTRAGRRHLRAGLRRGKRHYIGLFISAVVFLPIIWATVCALYRFDECFSNKGDAGSLLGWLAYPWPGGFVQATLGKLRYATRGNEAYLLGQHSNMGWWWYYPVALLLKTPLALVIAWIFSGFWLLAKCSARSLLSILPPLIYLVVATMSNRSQIGIRHILPVIPLMGQACAYFYSRISPRYRQVFRWLAAFAVVSGLRFLPFPICAESELLLGKGYLAFADANYDWGQANEGIRRKVSMEPELKKPQPYLPSIGRFIIRVNALNGFGTRQHDQFLYLRSLNPGARVGGAGLIYEITSDTLQQIQTHLRNRNDIFEMAVAKANAGDWEAAKPLFIKAAARAVNPEKILFREALMLEKSGATVDAYSLMRRAKNIAPKDGRIENEYNRMDLLLRAQKISNPAMAAYQRANAALLVLDLEEASKQIQSARLNGAPNGALDKMEYMIACLQGNWQRASKFLGTVSTSGIGAPATDVKAVAAGTATAAQSLELAIWSYSQHALPVAATLLMATLEKDPENSTAMDYLGEIIVSYKDWSVPMSESKRLKLEKLSF
jgi:tetratricopeptide (TPR) repeat protein